MYKVDKLRSRALVSCLAIAAFAGCQKAEQAVESGRKEIFTAASMKNNWTSGCQKTGLVEQLLGFPSKIENYDTSTGDKDLHKTTTLFAEAACATPTIMIAENGNWAFGNRITDNTYQMDLTLNTVAITPLNDAGKTKLAGTLFCGTPDWTVGVAKDVTAQSQGIAGACWTKTPRQVFDIAQASGDVLHFGAVEGSLDKSAPDKRPTKVDTGLTFTKKR